jgi:hypothetical protein
VIRISFGVRRCAPWRCSLDEGRFMVKMGSFVR